MPGKVKVKIIAGRNLPVMDRSAETTDAYCEIKLGTITHKTDVIRKSLNPQWNSDWFRFEVDDADLQDEPLQIRLMDYDTYSANDAIGKVYINLNPLLLPHKELNTAHTSHTGKGSVMSGWIPVYDTMHGIRGEVNLIVKVDLFSDLNKFRQSSCGVQFFHSHNIPHGYHAQCIHGFVEELVVNDDPEYQWIDKIRTPRASNEARLVAFLKFSGQVQRKIGLKAIDLGGNAVIGYQQCFDLEGDVGVVARGIGTAVTLVKIHETVPLPIVDAALLEERTLKYLEFLTNEVAKSHYDADQSAHNAVYSILGLSQHHDEVVASVSQAVSTPSRRLNRLLNRSPVRGERLAVPTDREKLDQLLHLEDSRSAKPAKKKFNLKLNKLKPTRFIAARRSSGVVPVRVAHKARSVDFSAKGDIHWDKGSGLPRSVSDNQNIQQRSSVTEIRSFFGGKGKRQKFQRSSSDGAGMANLLVCSMMVQQPLDSIHEHDSAGSSLKSTKGADAMHATIQRRLSVKSLIEELPPVHDDLKAYGSAVSSDFSLSTTGLESSSSNSDREDDDDADEDVSEACSLLVTPDNGPVDPETVSMVVRNVLADVDFAQADYFEPTRLLQVDVHPKKSPSSDSLDIHTGSTHVIRSRKGFVSESELIDRDTTESHTIEKILAQSGGDVEAERWIEPGSTRVDSLVGGETVGHHGLFYGLKEKIHHLQDHMHFHHAHKDVSPAAASDDHGKVSLFHDVKDALHHIHMPHLHISEKLHHLLPHGHPKEEAERAHGLFQTAMETMLLDKLNIMEAQTGLTPDEAVPTNTLVNRRRSNLDSAIERRVSIIKPGGSLDNIMHLLSHRDSTPPIFVSGAEASRPGDEVEWRSELKLSYDNLRKPLKRQNAIANLTNNDTTDIFRADLNTARIAIFVENSANETPPRDASPTINQLNICADTNPPSLLYRSAFASSDAVLTAARSSPSPSLMLLPPQTDSSDHSRAASRDRYARTTVAVSSSSSSSGCGRSADRRRSSASSSTATHRRRRKATAKVVRIDGSSRSRSHLVRCSNMKSTNNYRSLHASSLSPSIRNEVNVAVAGGGGGVTPAVIAANTSTAMSTANTISPVISHNNNAVSATPKMPATPRGDAKMATSVGHPSPARLSGTPGSAVIPIGGSSYGLCRRSSDSDLSITPKGNSLNERTSGFMRPGGSMMKPPLNHENLDMLEYPFITMGKYPNGFILHLGATVAARSVKLLERVPNPDEPETRDSWWNEIRMEIRSHARALGCNVVLGYSELTSITDDVCVLSATGTAAVVNLQYSADMSGGATHLDVSGASSKSSGGCTATKDTMTTSLDRQDFDMAMKPMKEKEVLTTIESDTELGTCAITNKENNGNAINGLAVPTPFNANNSSSSSAAKPCSMCHIPYVQTAVPFRISMLKCAICKRGKVPDVLLATIEMPESLQVTGRGCLLQAHVCRPKRDLRSESNAKEISDGLPFLEYELHKLLICKLKVKGMNALFGLKTTVTVGEKMIALVATATAVFLTALQPPVIPKVVGGNSWTDNEKLMELQRSIHETVDKNREIYQLKTFQEYDTNNGTASKQLFQSDTDDSDDELTELDLNMGNKDACVLEVDDIQDLEVISHLMEGCPPDGFHVVNTQAVPGLHDLEVVKNLQMFTQIWRAKLSLTHGSKNFSRHFQRLLQTIYFKLRTMMPCAICDLRFRLDFPEAEEIQLMVNGVALGLGEPSKLTKAKRKVIGHSVSKDAIKRVDEDLIFSLDEDQVTEVAPPLGTATLQHSGSLKVRKKSPIRGRLGSGRLTRHLPTPQRERYGVDITPLSYVPGARIDKYLGNLNFFFIRESTSVRENGGICGFVHSFVTELLAVVRAHVTALGGNAMIAFYMTELMLVDNPHKNQGQCLISVGGDVVFVSYFNED